MKKFITDIKTLAALLMASATFAACSSDDSDFTADQPAQPAGKQVYTMTVSATKGDNTTRGLSLDDKTLNAVWKDGETVEVYNASNEKIAELAPTTTGSDETTLTGTVTGTMPSEGNALTLKFLSPDYTSQDGTLAYIESHCDYATAGVTVSSVSGSNITTDDANFVNQQAIVKFTLIDKADGTAKLNPTTFSLYVNTTEVVKLTDIPAATYETNGDGVLYVALPAISNMNVGLMASVNDNKYVLEKSAATFANGQYYAITAKMENNLNIPLTFEFISNNTFYFKNRAANPVSYTINGAAGGTIANGSEGSIQVTAGDKVAFFGNNTAYATSTTTTSNFYTNSNNSYYVYGNVMSLIDSDDYATLTELTKSYTFTGLFSGNSNYSSMENHPYKDIMLPATTLTANCYYEMFLNCVRLTRAPDLPATTAINPKTNNGFDRCYYQMFYQCYALNSVKCLLSSIPKDRYTSYVTNRWVYNVSETGTITIKKGSRSNWDSASSNYSGIPSGWTVIEVD